MAKKKNKNKRRALILLVAVVLIGAALAGYFIVHKNNKQVDLVNPTAHTTSNLPTAQPSYSSGQSRSTSSSTGDQGGATDNNGAVSNPASNSQPSTSTSGLITLQSPSSGGMLSSGAQIYGTAQVGTVEFTLVDNSTGLLASGTLNVVNGKFSGTLQFKPASSSGKLNIFSQASASSPEANLISIPVGLE